MALSTPRPRSLRRQPHLRHLRLQRLARPGPWCPRRSRRRRGPRGRSRRARAGSRSVASMLSGSLKTGMTKVTSGISAGSHQTVIPAAEMPQTSTSGLPPRSSSRYALCGAPTHEDVGPLEHVVERQEAIVIDDVWVGAQDLGTFPSQEPAQLEAQRVPRVVRFTLEGHAQETDASCPAGRRSGAPWPSRGRSAAPR